MSEHRFTSISFHLDFCCQQRRTTTDRDCEFNSLVTTKARSTLQHLKSLCCVTWGEYDEVKIESAAGIQRIVKRWEKYKVIRQRGERREMCFFCYEIEKKMQREMWYFACCLYETGDVLRALFFFELEIFSLDEIESNFWDDKRTRWRNFPIKSRALRASICSKATLILIKII